MQEGAKNSLLKILEEPPPSLSIILTTSQPKRLLPTMLSRLREYRFVQRSADAEAEVIARIFRETQPSFSIESYLASFLSVNSANLYFVGAFFTASVAAEAVRVLRMQRRGIPAVLADLEKFTVPIGEEGGLGRPAENVKSALEKVIGAAEGFEIPGLFVRFLQQCSAVFSSWLRYGDTDGVNRGFGGAEKVACAGLWLRELKRTMAESDSFNITPLMALERLFEVLKTGMT
jgi:DNA polymerase-3 subunit gamma/tau